MGLLKNRALARCSSVPAAAITLQPIFIEFTGRSYSLFVAQQLAFVWAIPGPHSLSDVPCTLHTARRETAVRAEHLET